MRLRRVFFGLFFVFSLLIVSCGEPSDIETDGLSPSPDAPEVPIISDALPIPGYPPPESTDGPAILAMETLPASDIAESGSTFSLLISYDSVSFPTLDGLVLYTEGDTEYFVLPVVYLPGSLAVVSFTINDALPDGDYTIEFAIFDDEGVPGEYSRIILHVADVPSLDILELYPTAAAINPENRTYEPLNTVGRVVFSRQVTTDEYTLKVQNDQGEPVPGLLRLLPGNSISSLIPTQLLEPNSQYSITATIPSEEIIVSNTFYTETPIPLGAASADVVGRVYSFGITGDNVVEPESAKMIFALLSTAIPPFLIVVTELDQNTGEFSAYGGLCTIDKVTKEMRQDYRVPVLEFALDAVYDDPHFFAGPTALPISASVAGYDVTLTFHDFTQSGRFTTDGTQFVNGAISLYIDPQEITDLASEILGINIEDLCVDLMDVVGEVCDANGYIIARAEGVIGTYEPTVEALYDLLPDVPLPSTIFATAGGTIAIGGVITRNGAPAGPGYNISISSVSGSSPIGTLTPSTAVTGADGRFTADLDIPAGSATIGTDIAVTFDAVDLSDFAPEALERTINITVE